MSVHQPDVWIKLMPVQLSAEISGALAVGPVLLDIGETSQIDECASAHSFRLERIDLPPIRSLRVFLESKKEMLVARDLELLRQRRIVTDFPVYLDNDVLID